MIGEQLKRARERAGLTIYDLAQRADVTPSQISRIERGESTPLLTTAVALAAALGVPLSDLVDEETR